MKVKHLLPLVLVPMLLGSPVFSREPTITLHSNVTGNHAQPKVMYILPWQSSTVTHIDQHFSAELENDLFQALDRDEFIRELNNREKTTSAGRTMTINTNISTKQ